MPMPWDWPSDISESSCRHRRAGPLVFLKGDADTLELAINTSGRCYRRSKIGSLEFMRSAADALG